MKFNINNMDDNSPYWLKVGSKVWWNDPDHDFSSGEYEIIEIRDGRDENDGDCGFNDDTIILISNGCSEAEVWACELRPINSTADINGNQE